jgi:predicted AlkP superfamily phosphohydrolase/phosphomutase
MQIVFTQRGVKQSVLLNSQNKERVIDELKRLAEQLEDSNGKIVNISLTYSEGYFPELLIETRVAENEPRTKSNPY